MALAWMVVAWNLLWGRLSWGNLLGGLLVGVAVLVFFPLPPVTFGGRLRPRALLVFAVPRSSPNWSAPASMSPASPCGPATCPRGAIIAVPLRVRTDLNLALTAEAISLVPGTLIIDVDRDRGLLYVHVLDVRGPADLTDSRERVLATEARIVRAIGSAADSASDTPARGPPPSSQPDPRTEEPRPVTVLLAAALTVLLSVTALLALARLYRGPSLLDRVVAADLLLDTMLGAVGAEAAVNRHATTPARAGGAVPARLCRLGGAGALRGPGRVVSAARSPTGWAAPACWPVPCSAWPPGSGVLRFPDVLDRMHAATKPQVLGVLLLLPGLALRLRTPSDLGMLVLVGDLPARPPRRWPRR